MGLSNAKEEQLRKMPQIEFYARKSKDGKYIIHRTVITDIKPVKYYEKVLTSVPGEYAEHVDTPAEHALESGVTPITGDKLKA